MDEQVVNLNLMWMPVKNLTVLAAFRYTHEDKDSVGTFLDTNTTANIAPFTPTNPPGGFHRAPVPTLRAADTSDEFNNFAETLELRYTGINNWLFYARGDWEEESGNVHEHEVVGPTDQGLDEQGHRSDCAKIYRWRQLVPGGDAQHGSPVLSQERGLQ